MSFNLSKVNSGDWFYFFDSEINTETGKIEYMDPDPDSKERVCFRQIDADELRAIRDKYKGKKVSTPVLNPISKAMEIVTQYEQTAAQEKGERMEFWDKTIVDWEIFDQDGKPIPCTPENKYLLIKGDIRFLRFANRCVQLLSGITRDRGEEEAKNL
jgi:hypothetical protein